MFVKKIILALILICLTIYMPISIAEIWKKIHINSLIGFQKLVESSTYVYKINYDLWFGLIVPILNIPALILVLIISLLIFKK
jgi:hypothetical protein